MALKLFDSGLLDTVAAAHADASLDVAKQELTIKGLSTKIPLRNIKGKATRVAYTAGVAKAAALDLFGSGLPTTNESYVLEIFPIYPESKLQVDKDSLKFCVICGSTQTEAAIAVLFQAMIAAAITAGQVNGLISGCTKPGTSTLLVTAASANYDLGFRLKGSGTTLTVTADGSTVDSAVTVAYVAPSGTYAQVVKQNPNATSGSTYDTIYIPFGYFEPGMNLSGKEDYASEMVVMYLKSSDTDSIVLGVYIVETCSPSEGTVTLSSNAGTVDTRSGTITTEALTTAAGAEQDLTITNSLSTTTSLIEADIVGGTNTSGVTVGVKSTAAGSFVLTLFNTDTAALNGTVIVHFTILN